jgi:membrane-bound lytic murein transglycosylase MltF
VFKILFRLLLAMIFFASVYVIYSNTTYSSYESLKSKNDISVNFQNLPEMILPSRESSTGYQYELIKKYIETIGQKNLITENITYDINVYYTTSVCAKCVVINEEDLLIIYNVSGNEGKDVEVIQPFQKINLEYDSLDTFEINYSNNSIDELIYNIDNNLVTNSIITRSTYLFYKKYFPNLRIKTNLGKVILVWDVPGDDGSILADIDSFFQKEDTKEFISGLKDKYYSKNSISSYIFIGSRLFISDMITKLPKYESLFKKASEDNDLDWKLLASISYQESKWNNDAVSPTGVKGLMMLTQNTAKMLNVNRLKPNESIVGAARYFSDLLKKYSAYNEITRTNLALASYNAGPNHINDILLLAKNNDDNIENWNVLKSYLYKLNQKEYYKEMKYGYARGWEAVQYIENVKQYYDIITFLDNKDNESDNELFNEVPSTL